LTQPVCPVIAAPLIGTRSLLTVQSATPISAVERMRKLYVFMRHFPKRLLSG